MTFEQYWAILVKRWYIIVACFLVVGMGTYIGCKLMKPLYQSSSLVQVVIRSSSNNQTDYNNLIASDQLVQTEATLATGYPVLSVVASHYPGLSEGQLAGEVSSSTKTNTQLFEVDVVDQSPSRAANLANDVVAALIQEQSQAIQHDNQQAQQQLQQNIDQVSQQINSVTTQIAGLQAAGGNGNQTNQKNQAQIALLQNQLTVLQQRNTQFQTALAQLELTQAQSGNPLRVVQVAQPSYSPVKPDVKLYTGVGLLLGLLLGVLLATLYERLDTRVRTPGEVSRLLAWPILATVQRTRIPKAGSLVNPTEPDVNAEQYRLLRTNIGFSSLDKPLRSLVVTSPQSRDGKSSIAANLAIYMAKAGKSTLLIDADLHRPTQHLLFNLSPSSLGLSNAVLALSMPEVPATPSYRQFFANTSSQQQKGCQSTGFSLAPFVHNVGIPNLWVMPCGGLPPNPAEMLESKVMQRFMSVVANSGAEVVIFDTPPLLGLSDASILAPRVDGALIVIDAAHATKEKLLQVKALLSQTGVQVLGCVVNKLRHTRNGATYYYFSADEYSTEKSAGNGHNGHNGQLSPVPTTPMLVEPPYDRRASSN